jgi:hypothetical protein
MMNKYLALSSSLCIFILTLGVTAAWISSQEETYQDRLTLYSYVATLLSIGEVLRSNDASGAAISAEDLCAWVKDSNKCKSSLLKPKDTVSGVKTYKEVRNRWTDAASGIDFLAFDLPLSTSDSLTQRVTGWFDEPANTKINRAVYIQFMRDRWGWPAILVNSSNSEKWTIVQYSWSNLWFLRANWGRSLEFSTEEMEKDLREIKWPIDIPLDIKINIIRFYFMFMRVDAETIQRQLFRDARSLSENSLGTLTFDAAMETVLSRPRSQIKIPGLPETGEFAMYCFPIIFMYAALMFMSSTKRLIALRSIDDPWFLLNGKTLLEVLPSILVCVGLILSGIVIYWMVITTDLQLNVRLLRLQHYWTDAIYYQLRTTWLTQSYNSARDSGADYVDRLPVFGLTQLILVLVGWLALLSTALGLWRSYSKENSRISAFSSLIVREAGRNLKDLSFLTKPIATPVLRTGATLFAAIKGAAKGTNLSVDVVLQPLWPTFFVCFIAYICVTAAWSIAIHRGWTPPGLLPLVFPSSSSSTSQAVQWTLAAIEVVALYGLTLKTAVGRRVIWKVAFLCALIVGINQMEAQVAQESDLRLQLVATLLNGDSAAFTALSNALTSIRGVKMIFLITPILALFCYGFLSRATWSKIEKQAE